jgi:hypothetical protein
LHDDSSAWLLDNTTPTAESEIFSDWRGNWDAASPPLLWLTGVPEVGKTVTVALAIKHLQDLRSRLKRPEKPYGICFSYLRMVDAPPNRVAGQVLRLLLRRLLADLQSIPPEVEQLYKSHSENGTSPADIKIFELLKTVCGEYHSNVFIAIDGLDECKEEQRVALIRYLKMMPSNTKIIVTSRYLPVIGELLDTKLRVNVTPHKKDVKLYLERVMEDHLNFKQLIKDGAAEGEDDLQARVEAAILSNGGS